MSKDYSDQIQRYLENEMTLEERVAFEQECKRNPQFQAELDEYHQAIQAVGVFNRQELRNVLQHEEKKIRFRTRLKWILPLCLGVIALCTWFLQRKAHSPKGTELTPVVIPPQKDSSAIDYKEKDSFDTIEQIQPDQKTPPKIIKKPIKKRTQKEVQPVEETPITNSALFAEFFKTYQDDNIDIAMRGDEEEESPFERYLTSYAGKNYIQTVALFDSLSALLQQKNWIRLMHANALMSTGRWDAAEHLLVKLSEEQSSNYSSPAQWYLALVYLESNKIVACKKILDAISQYPGHPYKQQAQSLLDKLITR